MNYKCEECGFECMSLKLLEQHKKREAAGLTEQKERKEINERRRNQSR